MKPILIIQMQRMGDLILSYPLFLWLARAYPDRPLWVMADPQFAVPLARLSPAVRYLDFSQSAEIATEKFFLVINLSHRPESLTLAGRLRSEALIGGYEKDGAKRIAGVWQEYRASLAHNNRHNRFHWADLNAMDVIPHPLMAATTWQEPRTLPASMNRVGLFLGASTPEKRPGAAFWAALIDELERRGLAPLLLGGPAEKSLATEVQAARNQNTPSACGELGLDRFALFGQQLALMITPDTGPMHLAVWSGLKVLNLSLGPVHAWETGPYQPGHVVVRSSRDCVGCWQCGHARPFCHDAFTPVRVARISEVMLRGGEHLRGLRLPHLEIYGVTRADGLYALEPFSARNMAGAALGAYWQAFWRQVLALDTRGCFQAVEDMQADFTPLVRVMARQALRYFRVLTTAADPLAMSRIWVQASRSLRPLSGYIATHLSNHDCSPASRKRAISLAETHLMLLSTRKN